MSELENVGKRITAALDRVGQVLKSDELGAKTSEKMSVMAAELASLKVLQDSTQSATKDAEAKQKEAETKLEEATTKLAEQEKATARLQRELDEQRELLEGKVKFVRNKAWRFRKWSQSQSEEQKKMIEDLDVRLQALMQINRTLRNYNRRLRNANAEGLPDAQLINVSMQTELEGVRAHRDVEIAEMGAAHKMLQNLLDLLEFDTGDDDDDTEMLEDDAEDGAESSKEENA